MLNDRTLHRNDALLDAVRALSGPIFLVEEQSDGAFRYTHFSKTLGDRTGMDPAAMCSEVIDTLMPVRMAEFLNGNYKAALASETPLVVDETHSFHGADTWWRTTLSRAPDSPAGHRRLLGVSNEFTDIRQGEINMISEVASLKIAQKDMRAIAVLTAHDMRAPLANVISLTDLVLDGFRDMGNGKRDMLMMCQDVARSSISVIDGMISRVTEWEETDEPNQHVDLAAICTQIAGLVDPTKRLKIRWPDTIVTTDKLIAHACLRNLLDNAARFAKSRIDITVSDNAPPGFIELSVTDDGPGIADGLDPFTVAFRDAKGNKRGYGLSTITKLLRSLDGSLTHEKPANGKGCVFRAELPGQILDDTMRKSA